MKTKLIISLLIIGLATACGTKKNNLSAAYEVATEAEPQVQSETDKAATAKMEAEQAMSNAKITETKDRYQMENGQFVEKPFHIIVGSFKNETNAKNLRNTLSKNGMNAFVAVNKDGMFRVFAVSSDDEKTVRIELLKVRETYPDAWILKLSK
jgi:cell division septation protein DedD